MNGFEKTSGGSPDGFESGTQAGFKHFASSRVLAHWGLMVLLGAVLFAGPDAFGQAKSKEKRAPRTNRVLRESKQTPVKAPEPIVIKGVKRAAMGYPRVFTRVFFKGNLVRGEPSPGAVQRARTEKGDWLDLNLTEGSGPQGWWTSVLNTGVGGYALNQETAARFQIKAMWDALFYVQDIDGTVAKGVSPTVTLNIAGANGMLADTPDTPFVFVQDLAQFAIELQPYNPRYAVLPSGMNLVGMQAIRRFTFEIDPSNMKPEVLSKPIDVSSDEAVYASLKKVVAGPKVRIYPASYRPTNNIVVMPMRYVNYSQIVASDISRTYPNQAASPVLMGVKTTKGDREFIGNFLFDTGSPVTIISRKHAYQLGLIPSANPSFDKPEFRDSVTGAAGRQINAPGFKIDSLKMRNPAGQIIEWQDVPVLVHDVWIELANGSRVVRDGIIGNNLFLPSTDGDFADVGLEIAPAPFPRFWIHGPSGELWIERPAGESK